MTIDTPGVDIEGLAAISAEALRKFFDNPDPIKNEVARARIAATVLSTAVRARQTENARERSYFQMARTLADDTRELATYVRATMPDSQFVRALPQGKAEKAAPEAKTTGSA